MKKRDISICLSLLLIIVLFVGYGCDPCYDQYGQEWKHGSVRGWCSSSIVCSTQKCDDGTWKPQPAKNEQCSIKNRYCHTTGLGACECAEGSGQCKDDEGGVWKHGEKSAYCGGNTCTITFCDNGKFMTHTYPCGTKTCTPQDTDGDAYYDDCVCRGTPEN